MPQLQVTDLRQRYGNHLALDGVSFALAAGSIACLLGPSGCGKTTLLRCIAGFEDVLGGEIRLRGETVGRPGRQTAPEKRRIGMVFQDYALFPHLTVAANIGFGLHGQGKADIAARVGELLELVGLSGCGGKYPHELSGGQQQRVALARALAPRPELILLDEPFSNLDVGLRERLSLELRAILKREGSTAILVTHDQHEAFAMADEIGVMFDGRLQQWDSAYRLYHEPATRFVADFIGQGVLLPGLVQAGERIQTELGELVSARPIACNECGEHCADGCMVDVLLRPDDIIHDDASPLRLPVVNKAFRGAEILYTLRLDSGREVLALVPSHHDHQLGERIGIRTDISHVVAFRN